MAKSPKPQSEKSIAAILQAAVRQFAEKGYDGARVDRIAEEAGVNKALLYYHFQDKERLYGRVLMDVILRTVDAVTEKTQQAETAEDKLRSYITTLIRSIGGNRYFAPMVMREIAGGGATLPADAMEQFARIIKVLRGILEQGQASGEFKPIDPLFLHTQIIGGISFFIASEPIRRHIAKIGLEQTGPFHELTVEQAAQSLAGTLLNGLKT